MIELLSASIIYVAGMVTGMILCYTAWGRKEEWND